MQSFSLSYCLPPLSLSDRLVLPFFWMFTSPAFALCPRIYSHLPTTLPDKGQQEEKPLLSFSW